MLSHLEIRQKFLDFFVKRGHYKLPSASLIPEYDPTLLLTNSGMAPLKPFFLGVKKPPAARLTNVQKCLRTGDIESVGDIHHLTFFEMMGNWSVGGPGFSDFKKEGDGPYFKAQACELALALLQDFGLEMDKLYFGTFGGDPSLPGLTADEETHRAWRALGAAENRILNLPLSDSFWFSGPTGPCGPNTDVIYDLGQDSGCGRDSCSPTHDCGRFLEIWNAGVFMMYNRKADRSLEELPLKSVDAGAGLERFALVLEGAKSVYETDLFRALVEEIKSLSSIRPGPVDERSVRIVADHVRAATFLAGDGLLPSNVEAGYVLRRLVRRAATHGRLLGIEGYFLSGLSEIVVENFQEVYPSLAQTHVVIHQVLEDEERKFGQSASLKKAIGDINKDVEKSGRISGQTAFVAATVYGLPIELTREIARSMAVDVDEIEFQKLFEEHQKISRTARGVETYEPEQIKTAHTAAHLLNAALKKVLGREVHQMGQKIGAKEFRHDFNFGRPLTNLELEEISARVNEAIRLDLPVIKEETTFEKARAEGAEAQFEEKYRSLDRVTLYKIGPWPETHGYFSAELCGGPHASATGELKRFRILREEAVKNGVRRIRGVVAG